MNIKKMVTTVDAHTAGEPTRIVTGGIPHIPGQTMAEKKRWALTHLDDLRKMLMWEPRGHQDMFGAILTEPVSPGSQAGVIFMDANGYLDMCGHGSMGAATVLVDTGMVSLDDDENGLENEFEKKIVLDTPAGTITARVKIENGSVGAVTVCNVPAFYYDSLVVNLPGRGRIEVDIAYGGNFFALVNVKQLQLSLDCSCLDEIKALGIEIKKLVNESVSIVHPGTGLASQVDLTEIYQEGRPGKNIVVFGSGQVDRSPCGTGTCAKMAYLYKSGSLGLNEPYLHTGILNTTFTGRVIRETRVGNLPAIIPEITGRAHITGFHQFAADADDPFRNGFLLESAPLR